MKYLVLLFAALLCGCVSNAPFRGESAANCEHWSGCGSFYEKQEGYDLGFVEYTERGNDFNPAQTKALLENIKSSSGSNGVAIIVFIHGWKHNAATDDENVLSFQKTLSRIARSKVIEGKKLVGVYVGWRGLSFHGLQMENLTFWDRKATAEEVGRGGVTEFLLALENISSANDKNFLLTVGHSFGSAITLSALHDVLLSKMIRIERGEQEASFGDGVILLNPAIEANQALLLKEHSMKIGAMKITSPPLMYVVSSRVDSPTHFWFPLGQRLGVNYSWNENDIKREYLGRSYTLSETTLDRETVGNYEMFTTGYLEDNKEEVKKAVWESFARKIFNVPEIVALINTPRLDAWRVESRCNESDQDYGVKALPCSPYDPIDFLSVPESFINGHNDIFGDSVIAFLSSAVVKSKSERKKAPEKAPPYCLTAEAFSFDKCFSYYLVLNMKMTKEEEKEKLAKN